MVVAVVTAAVFRLAANQVLRVLREISGLRQVAQPRRRSLPAAAVLRLAARLRLQCLHAAAAVRAVLRATAKITTMTVVFLLARPCGI